MLAYLASITSSRESSERRRERSKGVTGRRPKVLRRKRVRRRGRGLEGRVHMAASLAADGSQDWPTTPDPEQQSDAS
jgi:hypothetical protein